MVGGCRVGWGVFEVSGGREQLQVVCEELRRVLRLFVGYECEVSM